MERVKCIKDDEWKLFMACIKEGISRHKNEVHRIKRNVAIMELLAYTACSLEELKTIMVEDIDFHEQKVSFYGTKKSQPRTIPLPENLTKILEDYNNNHRQQYTRTKSASSSVLFKVSTDTIQRVVRVYSEKALNKRFSLEDIRASRISALLKSTKSVWGVSYFLGIHDLTRLRRYIPDVNPDLISEIDEIKEAPLMFSNDDCCYLKSFYKRQENKYLRRI